MKTIILALAFCCCLPALAQEHEIIRSIYFGGGSYYIDEDQRNAINHFLDSLPYLENYQISISSHTDNIGGAAYNQWLSQMRSEAVMFQLTEKQIPREKVLIQNNGQQNPYFDNDTYIGRLSKPTGRSNFYPTCFFEGSLVSYSLI